MKDRLLLPLILFAAVASTAAQPAAPGRPAAAGRPAAGPSDDSKPAAMRVYRPNGLVVDFPDTMLIYDHGPLSFGGLNFVPIAEEPLRIVKTIRLPANAPHGKAKVRFPVFIAANTNVSG